nr:protein APCDD1-like [Lytechinus pictus]
MIVVQTARSNGLMSPDLNGPNWGPGSECRRRLRRLQGGQGIEAVTPPDLHGEWVSSSCETRPGPSYLTRRYKFHSDHSFTFYQFYYSDHQCQSPAYSYRIRGQLTVGGLTFTLDGANEAMYELEKVSLTVFQDRFAMVLARQLNGSCPGMVEPNQPLAIFRKYVVLDNSRDVVQIDCTPGLGFTMNELQMIRQEVYQRRVENTGIVRRSESLYLGDIHTDFGQRVIYRSKGYQTPLRRYDDDSEVRTVMAWVSYQNSRNRWTGGFTMRK